MDEQDREKYLKWLRNAKKLLAEKPFVYQELFTRLYNDICDETGDISEIFPLFAEADWSDAQILEFLYIGNNCDSDEASDYIREMSLDVNRVWQALKDFCFNDAEIICFIKLLDDNIDLVIGRLMSNNWSYIRIINALEDYYTTYEVTLALSRGSNDFKVIEILQLSSVECSTVIGELHRWDLARITKALYSSGYSLDVIYHALLNNYISVDIIKGMFLADFDPLLVTKIVYLDDNDSISNIIFVLTNNVDIVSNSSRILEQLGKDGDEIAQYLEDGYFTE